MVVKGGYGLFYDNIRTLLSMLGERTWHQAQQIIIANPGYPDPLGGRSREEFVSGAAQHRGDGERFRELLRPPI
jgi:hypothetical protein